MSDHVRDVGWRHVPYICTVLVFHQLTGLWR